MAPIAEDLFYAEGSDVKFNALLVQEEDRQKHPDNGHVFIWETDPRWVSGMANVPKTVSDVIVDRLQQIPSVSAIMVGRSGHVHHVWIMMNKWTAGERRTVYAAQLELVKRLADLELDFYAVAAENGEQPSSLVSDIHVEFERTA